MIDKEKIKLLRDRLECLKQWFTGCGAISDDEAQEQTLTIDEVLDQTAEGV